MKLELTCPSGLRSAIWSGRGSVAGALALGAARFPAQFEAASVCAAAAAEAMPDSIGGSRPAGKAKRCSTGRSGSAVKSNPPSEPTPEPTPISSIAGIIARGTPEAAAAPNAAGEKVDAAGGEPAGIAAAAAANPAGSPPAASTFSPAAFGAAAASGVPRAIIPAMEEIGVGSGVGSDGGFDLTADPLRPVEQRFAFPAGLEPPIESGMASAAAAAQTLAASNWAGNLAAPSASAPATLPRPDQIADLKPLGQVSSSFIVAVNGEGLWLVDQHVAHERVLFEQHLEARRAGKVEAQRMLMPLVIELSPRQIVIYEKIAEELAANGFEVEPMGPRSVAIQAVPAGIAPGDGEKLLTEILDGIERENAAISIETLQAKIAASTACHAAIKVNMPLDQTKMEWLLGELAKTDCPMSCPHGRPVVLRYSVKEIERAFHRI